MHRVIYSHGLQVVKGQFAWAKGVRKEPGVIRKDTCNLQPLNTCLFSMECQVTGNLVGEEHTTYSCTSEMKW